MSFDEKKYENYKPDILYKIPISETWWGQQWCQNLSKYTSDENRLSRGRTYTRQGRIESITIKPNYICSIVKGRFPEPYKIEINITPLSKDKYSKVVDKLKNSIEDINLLISAEFPESSKELLSDKENGIFPTLNEMKMNCSCPDDARICKHISATLYEFARLLDYDPLVFFYLRGIDVNEFLNQIIKKQTEKIMNNENNSTRTIKKEKLNDLFGIFDEYSVLNQDTSEINNCDNHLKKEKLKNNFSNNEMTATVDYTNNKDNDSMKELTNMLDDKFEHAKDLITKLKTIYKDNERYVSGLIKQWVEGLIKRYESAFNNFQSDYKTANIYKLRKYNTDSDYYINRIKEDIKSLEDEILECKQELEKKQVQKSKKDVITSTFSFDDAVITNAIDEKLSNLDKKILLEARKKIIEDGSDTEIIDKAIKKRKIKEMKDKKMQNQIEEQERKEAKQIRKGIFWGLLSGCFGKANSKSKSKNNDLMTWEQEEVNKGNYDASQFEEENLEEDDYYSDDLD